MRSMKQKHDKIMKRFLDLTTMNWLRLLSYEQVKTYVMKPRKLEVQINYLMTFDNKHKLHSFNNQPAVIYKNGIARPTWWCHGRISGPTNDLIQ